MQTPSPSAQIVEQRIRNRLIEYLEMVVSYEQSPPPFDLNEILNQWEDWVSDQPTKSDFPPPTYTNLEANHLIQVAAAWEKVCNSSPGHINNDVAAVQLPEWKALISTAEAALQVLRQRGKLSEDEEI